MRFVPFVRVALQCLALSVVFAALAACTARPPKLAKLGDEDRILAFGDSLTYGTGATEQESYPVQLAERIGKTVIKAAIPGEVTEEGLRRLPAVLDEHQPKLLLLCMGGNDMLRKLSDRQTKANLAAMIRLARERGDSASSCLAYPGRR